MTPRGVEGPRVSWTMRPLLPEVRVGMVRLPCHRAPRLPIRLGGEWDGTALALPERRWVNELTGEEVPAGKVAVADLLRRFPVALLSRADG